MHDPAQSSQPPDQFVVAPVASTLAVGTDLEELKVSNAVLNRLVEELLHERQLAQQAIEVLHPFLLLFN